MVIIVNQGESIQTAVSAASPGDTILVRPGVYNESVAIPVGKDRLRIVGAGAGKTIVDGTGLGAVDGFRIDESNFVTITGFTVRNFGSDGIFVDTSDNVIRNNEATQNGEDGIRIDGNRNLVLNNKATQNGSDGIEVVVGTRNYVIGNVTNRNTGSGIYCAGGTDRTAILDNEACENGAEGIGVRSDISWIVGNRTADNGTDGIDVDVADDVFVYGNTSKDNALDGLEVTGVGILAVKNNLIKNGGSGIDIAANDQNGEDSELRQSLIYANEMSYNTQDGLSGRATMTNVVVLRNDVDENGDDGIDLDGGDANRVLFNDVDDNQGRGIDVDEDSDGNLIDDNLVDDNHGSGIRLDPDADDNAVRANKLDGNRPFDILAEPPADADNTFDLNDCDDSSPAGICG